MLLYMVKENLAAPQVTYNRFHTTAICSPTRASLLLGYDDNFEGFLLDSALFGLVI